MSIRKQSDTKSSAPQIVRIRKRWSSRLPGRLIGVGALVLAVSMLILGPPASAAAGPSTTVRKVPFVLSESAQIDISHCLGERVSTTGGTFNVVRHTTVGLDGKTLFVFHRNIMDGNALGVTTGTAYQASGHLQVISVTAPSDVTVFTAVIALTFTSINGTSPSFIAHGLEHITITAAGDLTSNVDSFSIECL